MHYILDGYNIIHKTPAFQSHLDRSLQSARAALIQFCKSILQSRGDVAKITIVFDGSSDVYSDMEPSSSPEVVFTATGEDADDRIVEILRGVDSREAVVVSDDNYVRNSGRSFAAKVVPVAEFLNFQNRSTAARKKRAVGNTSGFDKGISAKERDEITRLYMNHLGLGKNE